MNKIMINKIKIALEFETDIANVYSEEEVDELAANIKSAVESNVLRVTGTEMYTYMTKNNDPDEYEIGLFPTM